LTLSEADSKWDNSDKVVKKAGNPFLDWTGDLVEDFVFAAHSLARRRFERGYPEGTQVDKYSLCNF
jgi:hypothetical protein